MKEQTQFSLSRTILFNILIMYIWNQLVIAKIDFLENFGDFCLKKIELNILFSHFSHYCVNVRWCNQFYIKNFVKIS